MFEDIIYEVAKTQNTDLMLFSAFVLIVAFAIRVVRSIDENEKNNAEFTKKLFEVLEHSQTTYLTLGHLLRTLTKQTKQQTLTILNLCKDSRNATNSQILKTMVKGFVILYNKIERLEKSIKEKENQSD